MPPADANILWKLQIGDGASPEQYTDICATYAVNGLGVTKSLLDITTYCSGRNREFKGGLNEGNEVTLEMNYKQGDTQVQGLMDDADESVTRSFRFIALEESPEEVFEISLAMLSWTLNPPIGDRGSMTFTGKITGPVVHP